jgi:uncharacterized Zn-binding protein involved in type VI secretion
MPPAARLSADRCTGAIITSAKTVFINNLGAARLTDRSTPHKKAQHLPAPPIVTASKTVITENLPQARAGDKCSCGCAISPGSPNTFAGG